MVTAHHRDGPRSTAPSSPIGRAREDERPGDVGDGVAGKLAFEVPAGATDCHHHIYDARWPVAPGAGLTPPDASVDAYRCAQRALGLSRSVIVQPSTYGFDNGLLVDALRRLGQSARGVAVVNPATTVDELDALHAVGVRGARVNLVVPGGAAADRVVPLAAMLAPRGWHLQIAATGDQILGLRRELDSLPIPVVFDHLGLLPLPDPLEHPAFHFICDLLARERAWVKLSGVANLSHAAAPAYADYSAVAREYARLFPERLVWGTDWPHVVGHFSEPPDDALLMNLLQDWLPSPQDRERVLVSNPAELYEFF